MNQPIMATRREGASPRRKVMANLIQVDLPTIVKKRIVLAAERTCGGNVSEWVRKRIYHALLDEGLLTPAELGMALAGLDED